MDAKYLLSKLVAGALTVEEQRRAASVVEDLINQAAAQRARPIDDNHPALKDLQEFLEHHYDTVDGDGACDRPHPNDWMRAGTMLDALVASLKPR